MRERERDQTHSYWYIPSAPRVNYSLLVMDSTGMMNMATGDGIPLRQGVGTGSRLVFGGYRGLRRRNSQSRLFSGGLGIYRRGWRQEQVSGPHGESTRHRGTPQGVGAPSTLVGPMRLPFDNFLFQYFLYFPKKSPLIFSAFRELLFLHKNNTTVVLLKIAPVQVSSNQIVPKSCKNIVNMA